jgi:hypothetical protein
MRSLREARLSGGQFAALAAGSILATVILIAGATGHSSAQLAVIAALRKHVVVHVAAPSAAASTRPSSSTADAASSPFNADQLAPNPPAAPAVSSAASPVPQGVSPSGSVTSLGTTTSSTTSTTAATATPATTPRASKIKHVFVIALSTPKFSAAFGPASLARYLNDTLRPQGTLLNGYRTLGASDLADHLAAISGQGPNADTEQDCPVYEEFRFGSKPGADGVMPGAGCVYPNSVLTIGDQVTSAGLRWGALMQDMTAAEAGRSPNCQHPNSNALDPSQYARPGDGYAARHNPFVYFHSLLDLGDCIADDQPLDKLPAALSSISSTPSYSFIAPSLCNDGSSSCAGAKLGGLESADAFLAQWVPLIIHSAAYRRDGALIIEFTDAPLNRTPHRPIQTGALVLSRYARPGRALAAPYDAYSLLRSVEGMLGFTALGHAARAKSFLTTALPGA